MMQSFTPEEKKRTYWVLGLMMVSILVLVIDSLIGPSIVTAEIWGYGFSAVFLILAFALNDKLLKQLFLFSLIAGFAELPADHYLVAFSKTLVYPPNEPMIWSSPAYMPFSWSVVLMEFGYISWLLLRKYPAMKAGLILAVLGACLVPLYEHWAISAGWWSYQNTPMIGPVPIYIIVAEGLLMIPVPYLVNQIQNGKMNVSIAALLEGLAMLIACFIALMLF